MFREVLVPQQMYQFRHYPGFKEPGSRRLPI